MHFAKPPREVALDTSQKRLRSKVGGVAQSFCVASRSQAFSLRTSNSARVMPSDLHSGFLIALEDLCSFLGGSVSAGFGEDTQQPIAKSRPRRVCALHLRRVRLLYAQSTAVIHVD